jgi:hypothetical protein
VSSNPDLCPCMFPVRATMRSSRGKL